MGKGLRVLSTAGHLRCRSGRSVCQAGEGIVQAFSIYSSSGLRSLVQGFSASLFLWTGVYFQTRINVIRYVVFLK